MMISLATAYSYREAFASVKGIAGLSPLDARPQFVLFYAELTSAGLLDPVTSLILHHRPDRLYQPGFLFERLEAEWR